MSKYKPGDKVKVREDLIVNQKYYMENINYEAKFTTGMFKLAGYTVKLLKHILQEEGTV